MIVGFGNDLVGSVLTVLNSIHPPEAAHQASGIDGGLVNWYIQLWMFYQVGLS